MKDRPTPFQALTAMQKCKRLVVAVAGGTVLAMGLALVVLPGPAFIIPAGLAILAMEFAWARRWLRKAKGLVPGTNPQRKHERTPSSSSMNYRRAKPMASFRNAISATQTKTLHQP